MRILLASFVANNTWTGMGKWTHCISEALASAGHESAMWFADDFPDALASRKRSILTFPITLARRIRQSRVAFDAVVVHEASAYWYGVLRQLDRSLPPLIVMCHNVESHHFAIMRRAAQLGMATMSIASRIKAPLARLWQSNGAIRMADQVVCLSSTDAQYLIEKLGVSKHVITRMDNGVEPSFFSTRPRPASARVLFVGGWLDVKGRHVLPSLWRHVVDRQPDATLTIVGSGVDASAVLPAFVEPIRRTISVVPRVTDPDQLRQLFGEHDVFLMPSLSEGCPLSMLEAMAAGLAVVATAVGGIPDVIKSGRNGLLFRPDQASVGAAAVCRLLSDRDLADSLVAAGQADARHLTWDAAAYTLERAASAAGHARAAGRQAA